MRPCPFSSIGPRGVASTMSRTRSHVASLESEGQRGSCLAWIEHGAQRTLETRGRSVRLPNGELFDPSPMTDLDATSRH